MITLGIDLSSQPDHTAACLLEWTASGALQLECVEPCDDTSLDALIGRADVVGIDAPFGWPLVFTKAISDWPHQNWTPELRDALRYRLTDQWLIDQKRGNRPLSVSTDQISLPAMRALSLLKRHGVVDRSGDGVFYEVYPAAALRAWGLPARGYKKKDAASLAVRNAILDDLRVRMPWLDVSDSITKTSDRLDSLIASLVTRAAKQGLTERAAASQQEQAAMEGWIHVPSEIPSLPQ